MKDYICLGECGATTAFAVGSRCKCIKCGSGAVWVGEDAEQRVKDEPGLVETLRAKYGD